MTSNATSSLRPNSASVPQFEESTTAASKGHEWEAHMMRFDSVVANSDDLGVVANPAIYQPRTKLEAPTLSVLDEVTRVYLVYWFRLVY